MRFPELLDVLPVIPIEQRFKLFGRSFELRMSSPLTLEPNTLFWVLMGETFQQVAKAQGSNVFSVLHRGLIKKQRLSKTTLAPVRQQLRHLLQPDVPEDASLIELLQALPNASAWATFQHGLGEFEGDGLCFLARRMAGLEELVARAVALRDAAQHTAAEDLLLAHTGTPSEFWAANGIGSPQVHLPLDLLCQALAALEASHAAPGVSLTALLSLLDPVRHPMGHWLRHQMGRAHCGSLQDLADRTQVADHDRFKAWSAGRDLLPLAKAKAIVKALGDDEASTEMVRYRRARVAAFLCEWVVCTTTGSALSWRDAQMVVGERYRALLAHAVSGRVGANQSSSLPPP
jgi:hypothetical protein